MSTRKATKAERKALEQAAAQARKDALASLCLATPEESATFAQEATEWFSTYGGPWRDASYAAKTAVAEFLANKQGLTLYESQVRK